MERIMYLLLTIFAVQAFVANDKIGNYQYDNLSEGQNVAVSFNNTGSFRYDKVVDDSLNASTIDHFDHKYHAKDDITYGCFGWRDPEGNGHITFYVSDSRGYRPFQTPRDVVRVFPRGAKPNKKVFIPFSSNGTFDKSFSESGITQNEDVTVLESPFECIQAFRQHVKKIRVTTPRTTTSRATTPRATTIPPTTTSPRPVTEQPYSPPEINEIPQETNVDVVTVPESPCVYETNPIPQVTEPQAPCVFETYPQATNFDVIAVPESPCVYETNPTPQAAESKAPCVLETYPVTQDALTKLDSPCVFETNPIPQASNIESGAPQLQRNQPEGNIKNTYVCNFYRCSYN